MTHFAELDDSNVVVQVVVINDEDCLDDNGNESEEVGAKFCHDLYGGRWLQTSINTRGNVHYLPDGSTPSGQPPFRGNYGSVGSTYDPVRDVFIKPKPHDWYRFDPVMVDWYCPHNLDPETGAPDDPHRGGYLLHALVPSNDSIVVNNPFLSLDLCTKNDYTPIGLSEATRRHHNEDRDDSEWLLTALVENNINLHDVIKVAKDVVCIDLAPLGQVLYRYFPPAFDALVVNVEELQIKNVVSRAYGTYTPEGCLTLHELFRLIIEWAWAHTELGNDEYPSQYCHDILRVLQMPLDVREALIEHVPYQQVGKFLAGDPEARVLRDLDETVPCPPIFTEWLDEVMFTYKFRQHNTDFNFDPTDVPDSYPGVE